MEKLHLYVAIAVGIMVLLIYINHKIDVQSQNKERAAWLGQHKSVILRTWGPPTGGVVSDGLGGEILTYIKGTSSHRQQEIVGASLVQKTDYCYVYIDKKQCIYDMQWSTS